MFKAAQYILYAFEYYTSNDLMVHVCLHTYTIRLFAMMHLGNFYYYVYHDIVCFLSPGWYAV